MTSGIVMSLLMMLIIDSPDQPSRTIKSRTCNSTAFFSKLYTGLFFTVLASAPIFLSCLFFASYSSVSWICLRISGWLFMILSYCFTCSMLSSCSSETA